MDTTTVTCGQVVYTRRLRWSQSDKSQTAHTSFAVVRQARRASTCDDCRAPIAKGAICASSEFGATHWCAACVTVRKPLMGVALPGTPRELLDDPVVPDYAGPATDTLVKGW